MRYVALLCGLAVGCFSMPAAFLDGLALVPGYVGYGIGTARVGLLVWSWLGGSEGFKALANRAWWPGTIILATWLSSVVTALWLSAGFVATNHGEVVADRQSQIDTHQRAKADWERLTREIQAADAAGHGNWPSTRELRQRLHEADVTLKAASPASRDATAETLSWVTCIVACVAATSVERFVPVWLPVAMELAGIGAFTVWNSPVPKQAKASERKSKSKRKPWVTWFKRSRRRSKPTKVVEQRAQGTSGEVIDIDKRRAQRATASWAP